MPVFVFCSGIVEKKEFRGKRLINIAIPYVLMSCIGVGFYSLFVERGNIYYVKQSIYNVLIGGCAPRHGIYPVESLWFLSCLAAIYTLFHFLGCGKKGNGWPLMAACAVAGMMLISCRERYTMYYNIDIALVLLPFYYAGFYFRDQLHQLERGKKILAVIAGIILYCTVAMINGEVNIFRGVYGRSAVVFYLAGLLGSLILLLLSKWIQDMRWSVGKLLSSLGRYTQYIMVTHQIIIYILRDMLGLNAWMLLALSPVVILISYACSFFVQNGISTLTRRMKV